MDALHVGRMFLAITFTIRQRLNKERGHSCPRCQWEEKEDSETASQSLNIGSRAKEWLLGSVTGNSTEVHDLIKRNDLLEATEFLPDPGFFQAFTCSGGHLPERNVRLRGLTP